MNLLKKNIFLDFVLLIFYYNVCYNGHTFSATDSKASWTGHFETLSLQKWIIKWHNPATWLTKFEKLIWLASTSSGGFYVYCNMTESLRFEFKFLWSLIYLKELSKPNSSIWFSFHNEKQGFFKRSPFLLKH